jgi:hypothetical protein
MCPIIVATEIFGRKFWQHGDVGVQWFIYRERHQQRALVMSAGPLLLRITVVDVSYAAPQV